MKVINSIHKLNKKKLEGMKNLLRIPDSDLIRTGCAFSDFGPRFRADAVTIPPLNFFPQTGKGTTRKIILNSKS
jgi:hypothetical protein